MEERNPEAGSLSTTRQPDSYKFEVKDIQSLIALVSTVLSSVLGLGVLATISGFVVVNQYLSRYTDIHSFNISPNKFIAAGIPVLIIGTIGATTSAYMNHRI